MSYSIIWEDNTFKIEGGRMEKGDWLRATLILLIGALLIYGMLTVPQTSENVVISGRTATIPEGSQLVLYYTDTLFMISSSGNVVTISDPVHAHTYNLCDPECTKDLPIFQVNTVKVEKVEGGIKVEWPFWMINK